MLMLFVSGPHSEPLLKESALRIDLKEMTKIFGVCWHSTIILGHYSEQVSISFT